MIKVYGQSDDLVTIEGDIEEEYSVIAEPCHIIFSDGTLISVEYSPEGYDSQWKINVEKLGENTSYDIESAIDVEDDYSDVLTLEGPIIWCIRDIRSMLELRDHLRDNLSWELLSEDCIKDIYITYFKTLSKEKV